MLIARLVPLCLALGLCALAACGDVKKKEDKSEARKADAKKAESATPASQATEPATTAKPVPKWAVETRAAVADIQSSLINCRDHFLIPFKFDLMKRRDVTFVSLTEMDISCRGKDQKMGKLTEEDKKLKGPWEGVRALRESSLGKSAELDRFLLLTTDFVDHYRRFSTMCKKIGGDIDDVVKTAKEAHDHMMRIAPVIDDLSRLIAKWPDDLEPDDHPAAVSAGAKNADLKVLLPQLAKEHEPVLGHLAEVYENYAVKSIEDPRAPLIHSLKMNLEVAERRLARDRARISSAPSGDEKLKKLGADYLLAADGLVKTYAEGIKRYEDRAKFIDGKDPKRKAVQGQQKSYDKLRAKLAAM